MAHRGIPRIPVLLVAFLMATSSACSPLEPVVTDDRVAMVRIGTVAPSVTSTPTTTGSAARASTTTTARSATTARASTTPAPPAMPWTNRPPHITHTSGATAQTNAATAASN